MNLRTISIIIVALVVVVVAGLYLNSTISSTHSAPTTKTFTLKVENRKVVEGSGDLTANQGDTVVINITCDEDEELHLHGYDRAIDLAPNTQETLTLVANMAGHFPFELEHSKTELGALSVLPK